MDYQVFHTVKMKNLLSETKSTLKHQHLQIQIYSGLKKTVCIVKSSKTTFLTTHEKK